MKFWQKTTLDSIASKDEDGGEINKDVLPEKMKNPNNYSGKTDSWPDTTRTLLIDY